MLTADNAARVRDSIDEANVIELFTGAKMTGDSIHFRQNGRIILSSIEPNTAGAGGASTGQWIRWQRCDGRQERRLALRRRRAPARPTRSLPAGRPGRQPDRRLAGTAVMVVEVVYDYQPIVSNAIFGPRTIRYESAFNVRQRTNQALTNTAAPPPRNCNVFNA